MTIEFKFNKLNLAKAKEIIAKYPEGRQRSAILPLLDIAQRQNSGWLSKEAIEYVADMIQTPHIRAYEVVTFYTMFNTKPVGKYHLQVCGTTPCWLRGAADIMETCEQHLKIKCGESTKDGLFTISEVECLGACVDAPVVQINDDFFENVTSEMMQEKLIKLAESNKKGIT
jgi:NADH-quinone oxidoreductase E subunit